MKGVNNLLEELRKEWRPSDREASEVKRIAAAFVRKLASSLKRARINARPVVGGSGAKGTWLRGMHDIDVFVCFDYKKYKEESDRLSEFLAAAMKKAFQKYERLHGSRDYFRTKMGGYNFEVVPILGIRKASQALNITDVSLLHSGWVNKKISKNKAVADETRLAKAFCKAQRVYGAESYVRGFSGYACEVLTAYYGSFLKLITAASKWKKQIAAGKKIIIDAERHYKGKDPLRELNQAKVQSSLVVIDPVQKDRNATAALSNEVLERFIAAAVEFTRKPAKSFFERQQVTVEKLRQKAKGKRLVVVEAIPQKGKEDVVGAKLVKAFERMLLQLKEKGFAVAESCWEWEKHSRMAMLWYIINKAEPELEIRYGPPLSNKQHAEKFRQEHLGKEGRRLFEKSGRLYARIERKHKHPQQLISELISEDAYLKDKARNYSVKSFEQ